jgi:hypothetical protein
MRLRLQSMEATYTLAESESPELLQSLTTVHGKWRQRIHSMLIKWARLEQTDSLTKECSFQTTFTEEMEQALAKLQRGNEPGVIDRQDLRNIYAVFGSIQSLLDAMRELGDSMQQINWHQWAVARF